MTEIPNPPDFTHLLVVPHVRVQNANAVSSPLTHGFPSITAFLGQMGALERNVRSQDIDWAFKAVGVVCHDYAEQVVEPAYPGAPTTFCLTRNPVDKDGGTAAIVEEGRIHLDITLIYAVSSDALLHADDATLQTKADAMGERIACMRLAGGSILHRPWTRQHRPRLLPWSDQVDTASQFRKLLLRLLPGHVLVGRDDLLAQRLAHLRTTRPHATALDALLSLSRVNWHSELTAPAEQEADTAPASEASRRTPRHWQNDRTGQGWIVPIPVGYGRLGDLLPAGSVARARDASTPFRFVESLYSIGEWRGAHRLRTVEELLWWADGDPDAGYYRCRSGYGVSAMRGK